MDTQQSNLEELQAQGAENTPNEAPATAAGAGISNQADTAATDAEVEAETMMSGAERHGQPTPVTKESLLESVLALLAKEPSEYSGDEISRLRQKFSVLHSSEAVEAEATAKADETEAAESADTEPAQAEAEPAEIVAEDAEAVAADMSVEAQFDAAIAELRRRKTEWTAQLEATRAANLERKNDIIAQILALADDTDNVNRTFPRYRELQDEFNATGEVDPTQETAVWKRFQEAREQYSDNLKINKELRDYDFKKNLAEKESLLAEARTLTMENDVIAAYRRLQELHNKWRQIGPVAKELREQIWSDFREASAEINKRYQAFFEARKARESENEAAKTVICERMEAIDRDSLKTFAAWEQATETVKQMQAEWRTLGFASKKMNRQLFARFRSCCDTFFAAKAEFFRNTRSELAANLARKQALTAEAEELSASTDWRKTADRLTAMQKEWRTIGAVPKKYSEDLWKRFTGACDAFFENRKKAGADTRHTENQNLKTKREIIGELSALITDDAERNNAIEAMRALQTRWNETGHVPFREKEKLYTAYREAIDAVRRHFDMAERGARRRKFAENVEQLEGDNDKIYRERERLMRAVESRRNELRTYENNLGFLSSKSKSGDSLVRDMERRIERLKADIDDLVEKVKLLDGKLS